MPPVLTCVRGDNSDLIAEAARLYLKKGMEVADVTFGRGVFWKKVDLGKAGVKRFWMSDIDPKYGATVLFNGKKDIALINKADFRDFGMIVSQFDIIVLDPPYMHGGATVKKSIKKCYGNGGKSTKYASHEAILGLYHDGMIAAWRALKPGGLLWVKCQDEIESGKQKWSHVEILDLAGRRCAQTQGEIPFTAVDLFVLMQATIPARRLPYQLHARKNHSYLWIFKKL